MVVGIPPGPVVFGASALEGVTGEGERTVIAAMEQPEVLRGFSGEVDQRVLERFHLERYRSDYLLRRGRVPFEGVREGDDPPDFIVSTDAGDERLDSAVLAREERRNAHRLFQILHRRLTEGAHGRDFSGILGTSVQVWFGERMERLPPKKTDDSIVDPLLDVLAAARVDREGHRAFMEEVAKSGFPEVFPQAVIATGKTPDGAAGFVANIVCSPEQAGQLPGGLGLLIQLHMPRQVTLGEMKALLNRLVADHDKPEIEHLLITAGGPDRSGIRYPAEEIFAALLAQEKALTVVARHLRRVTLHMWSSGDIFAISMSGAAAE